MNSTCAYAQVLTSSYLFAIMPATVQQYGGCFVSPHPDDIAFSCYASLRNPLTAHQKFLVITVFDQSLFSFNKELSGVEGISQIRKDEDQAFCRANNCDYMSLNLPDSSVRYKEVNAEYKIGPAEDPIFETAKKSMQHILKTAILTSTPIYVPLGNSLHLDHLIVRDAVRDIVAANGPSNGRPPSIFYYEDLPYAARWTEARLHDYAHETLGPNCAWLNVDLNRIWNDKLRSCKTYASQIEEETIPMINKHALSVAKGSGRAERLWYQPTTESVAFDHAVDTVCWVAWEACRLIGGGGVALLNIINSMEYRRSVRRTLLIGPMYMPRDCVEYDPFEDVAAIASQLKSKILYHPLGQGCRHELSRELYNAFREIEFRHGVELVFMRDASTDEHVVERLLFNFSANILPKHIFSPSLQSFINELRDKFDLDVQMDNIRTRSPGETARLSLESLQNRHPFDNMDYNSHTKKNIQKNRGEYGHVDNDYIYGLMLGQPAAEAMRAVLSSPRETCLLVAQEYLSLPTAYATILAKPPKTIKTLYYAGEVHPICNLAVGLTQPRPVLSNAPTNTGEMWDGPLRTLINYINKHNQQKIGSSTCAQTKGMREAFLDIEPLLPLQTHGNVKIIQHAWKLDKTLPLSANVLDDLRFFDRGFNFDIAAPLTAEQLIFSHGIVPIRNTLQRRAQSRIRLLAYARHCWDASITVSDEASWVIVTRISRAVAAKAMYRDLAVVETLGKLLPQRKVLFVIITSWDAGHGAAIIDPLVSESQRIVQSRMNTFIHIVNSFSWPKGPESGHSSTYLTREDIHCAADVSLCLSSYDAYSLTALEGLSCGSLCVMSMSCGAARRVQSLGDRLIDKNVLVVDYGTEITERVASMAARGAEHREIVTSLFLVADREEIEARVAETAARGVVDRLPGSTAEQQAQIDRGWELAEMMSWDAEIRKSFIPVIKGLFAPEKEFNSAESSTDEATVADSQA